MSTIVRYLTLALSAVEWLIPIIGPLVEKKKAAKWAMFAAATTKVLDEYRAAAADGNITPKEKDRILFQLGQLVDSLRDA